MPKQPIGEGDELAGKAMPCFPIALTGFAAIGGLWMIIFLHESPILC
jgi:hypothetical protein